MKNNGSLLIFGILALVVLAIAAFIMVPKYTEMRRSEERLTRKIEEKNRKTGEVLQARKEVDDLRRDPKAVESVARKKFNMSKEGEVVMTYPEEKAESGAK